MSKLVKVAVKEVGKGLEVKEMALDLKAMQTFVDGYIEMPFICRELSNAGIDIVINEEGKLIGLEENIAIVDDKQRIIDMLVGNVMFVGHDGHGRTIGLNEEQIKLLKNTLKYAVCVIANEKKAVGVLEY